MEPDYRRGRDEHNTLSAYYFDAKTQRGKGPQRTIKLRDNDRQNDVPRNKQQAGQNQFEEDRILQTRNRAPTFTNSPMQETPQKPTEEQQWGSGLSETLCYFHSIRQFGNDSWSTSTPLSVTFVRPRCNSRRFVRPLRCFSPSSLMPVLSSLKR